jgi:predicted transcriptional regulator
LEALSKKIFNSESRLTIVHEFGADSGLLNVNDVATRAGVATSTAFKEVNQLAEFRVLQRVEVLNSVAYQKIDGPFWKWCDELITDAAKNSSDENRFR